MLNLIPSDINRPLSDLRFGIKVRNILETVKNVIEDLAPVDIEVQGDNGKWYLIRIRPYLTMEKKIDCAILSFVDITEIIKSRREIESIARFPSENPYPVLRIARNGTVMYRNPACKSLIGEDKCSVGHLALDSWRKLVLDVLNSGKMKKIDEIHGNMVFSFSSCP